MAIETLRPNGAGDETSIPYQEPFPGSHYDKVDEVTADEYSTTVYVSGESEALRDLYALPDSSGVGSINKVTVFFRCHAFAVGGKASASLKAGSTVSDGDEESLPDDVWTSYSHEWAANPDDSAAWEWGDIDALQIGVVLRDPGTVGTECTQVYVEVDYTPSRTPRHAFVNFQGPGIF